MKQVFGATVLAAALIAGSAAMAQAPSGGSGPDSDAAGSLDKGEPRETYRSTGPGASSMSPGERRQMDQCTKFASWYYCKRQMLGR